MDSEQELREEEFNEEQEAYEERVNEQTALQEHERSYQNEVWWE